MDRKKKIIAAISAAIYAYLEQEAMAVQTASQIPMMQAMSTPQPSIPITSPWSFAGRFSMMERRFNWRWG